MAASLIDDATLMTLSALADWVERLIRQPVGSFHAELGRCLAVICGAAGECQARSTVAPILSLSEVMSTWCGQRELGLGIKVIDVIRALDGEN